MIRVYDLTTEHKKNPLGIDEKYPRLSWKLDSDQKNVYQKAWQIQTSFSQNFGELLWDSGRIDSEQSLYNRYAGPELHSCDRIYWRVKVWSGEEESCFSEPAWFEMGLLQESDWLANWIEPERSVDYDEYKPASYLRKSFCVRMALKKARIYLTAHGTYYFYINGKSGSDDLLSPGFTSYYTRLQVQSYDITDLLQCGENVLGIILGDGWWRGSCGGGSIKNNFGYKTGFLGQIILDYEDGSREIIGSDESFLTSIGPLQKTDIKGGEIYDARLEQPGWNCPGFDDTTWNRVQLADYGKDMLIASRGVPVHRYKSFHPIVLRTPKGETVLDFGQNINGQMDMKVQGERGQQITMVFTECLDREGNFTQKNIQQPKGIPPYTEPYQENTYILKGACLEEYVPLFSIQGFRYVLLKGYPGEVKPGNFTAWAISSDCPDTGKFYCSNEDLNRLESNCRWTGKNNYADIPTDCPTRERAGWLGDAQVFSRTAADFMDVYAFFEKWTLDIKAEQYPNGVCCNVAPTTSIYHNIAERERKGTGFAYYSTTGANEPMTREGYAGWGDACVIIPWNMYLCYGDESILHNMYETAKAWVEYERACAKDRNPYWMEAKWYQNVSGEDPDCDYIWDTKYQLGEWYEADFDIDTLAEYMAMQHVKSAPYLATAFYAYSTRLLSKMAHILGHEEDYHIYSTLADRIKTAYNRVLVGEDGSIWGERHAESIRALAFDLVNENMAQRVADKLNRMLIENGYHFNSGYLSTGFLIPVLCRYGYTDTAFKILLQREMPSWLYEIDCGATTVWEIWSGIDENGVLEGSQDHYSPAAVANSFFTIIAGIQPLQEYPGYKRFLIHPTIGGELTEACAEYESPYGKIMSSWKVEDGGITYSVIIPANTSAEMVLPYSDRSYERICREYPEARRLEHCITIFLGSGSYRIQA